MRALVAGRPGQPAALGEVDDPTGDLVIDASWSSVNYKDALAVTGRPGVLRSLPMVPGIDVVGEAAGRTLVVTGTGLGERRDGGYAARVAVDAAAALEVPAPFTARQAAAIGTAGLTAALAVLALQRHGIGDGPVLVTGAGGGVGGFAIVLLSALGLEAHASTGRADAIGPHLRSLGAAEVIDRIPAEPGRPLQPATWAGVVDAVGGGPLVNAIAATRPGGTVAACGLAAAADLPGSVLPFILRGVTLAGVYSVDLAPDLRRAAWDLLARYCAPEQVDRLTERTIGLADVPTVAEEVLAGRIRGRVLVDLSA